MLPHVRERVNSTEILTDSGSLQDSARARASRRFAVFLASSLAFFAFILARMSAAGFSSGAVFLIASRVFGVVYCFKYQLARMSAAVLVSTSRLNLSRVSASWSAIAFLMFGCFSVSMMSRFKKCLTSSQKRVHALSLLSAPMLAQYARCSTSCTCSAVSVSGLMNFSKRSRVSQVNIVFFMVFPPCNCAGFVL